MNFTVKAKTGTDKLANVYIIDFGDSKLIECVESIDPALPREEKWVLIISTMFGCPVGCLMCDAGGDYHGKLSYQQMLAQIDFLVSKRYPKGSIPTKKFKIQFARMGEPSFNPDVITLLEKLPSLYNAPGLMPAVSTIAPKGSEAFFEKLVHIKNRLYPAGKFQLQFSIHSTDPKIRKRLIPIRIWALEQIADYGEKFYRAGDRKITLNFALAKNIPVDVNVLTTTFDSKKFLIKITPVNPTLTSIKNNLQSRIDPANISSTDKIIEKFQQAGFQVIVSIGNLEENNIGSNCGQFVSRYLNRPSIIKNAYTYKPQPV